MSWRAFWDGEHAIYVNDRHRLLHARLLARDLAPLIPSPEAHVLDHGCGEALAASDLVPRGGRLYLCDGSPGTRQRLRARLAREGRIVVMAPEEIDRDIPDASLDLVVAVSLVQYLTQPELADCLAIWRAKLKLDGRLLIGDVIPAGLGPLADAAALLRFGFQGGFLFAAVGGLARTFLSRYRTLRRNLGLARYNEAEFIALLTQAGFVAEYLGANIGHNQARMSFLARRRADPAITE